MAKKCLDKSEIKRRLQHAKNILEKPDGWVKGMSACDSNGDYVDLEKSTACRFSILGALYVAIGKENWGDRGSILPTRSTIVRHFAHLIKSEFNHLYEEYPELSSGIDEEHRRVAAFNDNPNTTHDDVMALFDTSIKYYWLIWGFA